MCYPSLFCTFLTEGEIQGTVHRRLLEDRVGELKVGAVLLLKQVRLPSVAHEMVMKAVSVSYKSVHGVCLSPLSVFALWTGGCVFPLPSQPLPKRDA